jgi:hypothetical protein
MWLTELAGGPGVAAAAGNRTANTRRYEVVKSNKIKTTSMTEMDIGPASPLVYPGKEA